MNIRKICPICAVVVITWVSMLLWLWTGHTVDRVLLALLMGMSAGAVATKYGHDMVWKSAMVILAIPAIWFATKDQPGTALIFLALVILPTVYFNFKLNDKKGAPQPDRFKDCC